MRPETRLVSIMAANNVIGTIQPIAELAEIARRRGVLFHTDAVQAVGKIALDMRTQPIDLLSLSGHKLHGPKGVGALYVREGVELWPLLPGGGQERGRRSGTENVAGYRRAGSGGGTRRRRAGPPKPPGWSASATTSSRASSARITNAYLIGHRWRRLPGHICLGFDGLEGEAIKLLLELDKEGIAISSGSACSAIHAGQPSHVLEAMGFDRSQGPRLVADIAGTFQYAWTRPTGSWRCCPRPSLRCGLSGDWRRQDDISRSQT